jgi:hypothetical protein
LCTSLVDERFDGQPSDDDMCVIALRVGDATPALSGERRARRTTETP